MAANTNPKCSKMSMIRARRQYRPTFLATTAVFAAAVALAGCGTALRPAPVDNRTYPDTAASRPDAAKPAAPQGRAFTVKVRAGDGLYGIAGWPEQAPFPRILATAAAVEAPPALLDQLEIGGILVIPLGANASDQNVVRLTKREDGFDSETLWPVRFVPMIGD